MEDPFTEKGRLFEINCNKEKLEIKMKYLFILILSFCTTLEMFAQKYEQGLFETDGDFSERVANDYVQRYIQYGKLKFSYDGIYYEKGGYNYITDAEVLRPRVILPYLQVNGDITRETSLSFSIELYDNDGLKIAEKGMRTLLMYYLRPSGSGIPLSSGHSGQIATSDEPSTLDIHGLSGRKLYEDYTIVLKVNGKIIFSRKDTLANFLFGESPFPIKNGKYCLIYYKDIPRDIQERSLRYDFSLSN